MVISLFLDSPHWILFGLSWVLGFDLPLPPGSKLCVLSEENCIHFKQKLNVYLGTLSKCKSHKAVIMLSNDAVPKVCNSGPMPYALYGQLLKMRYLC